MSTPGNETILITVDIKANNERLVELTKQLNENKAAQKALADANKAGKLSADDLAAGQVRLKTAAAAIAQETRALTKANQQQEAANKAAGGSVDELKAKLALATTAYNALSAAERDNSAAGQKLQAETKAISEELLKQGAAVNDYRRNVGNYAGSIGPLIQELVKLQEQQKSVGQGTVEYQNITKQIGFVTKATQDAGAKAGLSYDQTQAKLKEYGDAVRPVIAEVVKLEKEQEQLDESSEAYTRIGFKLAGVEKKLEKIPVETKAFGSALKDAAGQSEALGGALGKVSELKEKYTQATNLAKLATGGEVTALGALRLALIATGLGALVVVLGSVVVFLTKTAEGTRLVENVMAQVGAVVNVVIDRLGNLGKAVVQVLSGDFTGAASTAKAAFSGLGDEIQREVKIAGDLSKAQQQLDRDTANNIDTNKRLLNEVERLKNVRDNEFNTLQVRKKANEDAYAVELEREKTLSDLARRRIAILKAEIDQRGGESKASLEQLKEYKEAQNELSDIQEDAAGKQNELITNRFQLNKAGLDAEKANAAALEALRKKKDDAMLKSIEADIAAGLSREAAAAKYLADEDKARALQAQREEQARTDKLAADAANYAEQESMLERFLARMGAKTATDYAAGLLDKRGYDAAVEQQESISYASRIMLATKFGKDATALVQENARREIAAREKAKDQQQRIKDVEIGITQAGAAAAAAATDAFIVGVGKESDAGQAALIIKKGIALAEIGISLEKQLAANALAGAKISAEAPPITVPVGIAYTTSQNVLAIAEAAVSAATVLAFNTGGVVPGQGNTDTVPAMLTPGEVVMNKQASQTYLPLLSHLNNISGGVAFATGGLVPGAPSRATPINDGGFLARQLGSTPPQLDYPTLIKAIADYGQFDVGVRNIERATTRRAMPRAASTLGG